MGVGPGLCKMLEVNFYEKALFVKSRRGGRSVANATAALPFALCFYAL
jgi:hypothetical protein